MSNINRAAQSSTNPNHYDLDDLLGEFSVGEVDAEHIEVNKGQCPGIGWWWVCNDDGVIAYFAVESDAFRFRLAEINRKLNP